MSNAKYLPHYTFADYRLWEGDWELWSGVPVAMTPSPFGPHQLIAARLIRLLGNALASVGCDCEVLHEIDWVVSDDTVVRPDVVVVCGGVPQRHLMEPPALIAEVTSPSTAGKDRQAKYELYQQQAVPYYLIVDPASGLPELYQRSESGSYVQRLATSPIELTLATNCQITIDLNEIYEKR